MVKNVVLAGESKETENDVGKHEQIKKMIKESDTTLKKRPPVIVIMGHVDHGKTKLLDTIKKTNVVAEESGGITQHIGAYQIEKKSKKITFIDTPGHEAFTTMRTRGSRIADIAILVVAADDGVQPQTKEALRIIKNAGIPMLVAINKIDKPAANIEKIKKELSENNVIPEEWGGDTIVQPISAHTGDGIDNLLETLLLIADTEEENLKTDWKRLALGTVIESHMDKSEGTVATILVQAGILKTGSIVSIDNALYGRIRVMKNHLDEKVKNAEPGTPVKILGLKAMPTVGDIIEEKESEKGLEKRVKTTSREQFASPQTEQKDEEDEGSSLKIILKTDTLGSAEAIVESIAKLNLPKDFKIDFVHKGLGNINENDVQRAKSADAVIVGFHIVTPTALANVIDDEKVIVKNFEIIYELLDFLKEKIVEVVKPTYKQKEMGALKILKNFKQTKKSQVVGGSVTDGEIKKGYEFSLLRKGQEIGKGKILELQSGKEAVTTVAKGAEAGLEVQSLLTIEEGDNLEVYETIEEQIKL